MPPKTRPARAKRTRVERGQPSGSNEPNPNPNSDPNPNPTFEDLCFSDGVHRNRYFNVYHRKEIRLERNIDLNFLMSPVYDFDLFELFTE